MSTNDPNEVYGIIYVINCTKTKKKYVGQTLSHTVKPTYDGFKQLGMQQRFIWHCKDSCNEYTENRPLYSDMKKYGIDKFKISEYKRIPAKEIHNLDYVEEEAIKELNTLQPNGYNMNLQCKVSNKTKDYLKKFFEINHEKKYVDPGRQMRSRQLTIPNRDKIEEFFEDKEIDGVNIVPMKVGGEYGTIKLHIKVVDSKDSYKIALNGNKELSEYITEAREYAKRIVDSWKEDPKIKDLETGSEITSYKYQDSLNKFSECKKIRKISGYAFKHAQHNNADVYIIQTYHFDSTKKDRKMFGGRTSTIDEAFKNALEFIIKLAETDSVEIDEYKINNPINGKLIDTLHRAKKRFNKF